MFCLRWKLGVVHMGSGRGRHWPHWRAMAEAWGKVFVNVLGLQELLWTRNWNCRVLFTCSGLAWFLVKLFFLVSSRFFVGPLIAARVVSSWTLKERFRRQVKNHCFFFCFLQLLVELFYCPIKVVLISGIAFVFHLSRKSLSLEAWSKQIGSLLKNEIMIGNPQTKITRLIIYLLYQGISRRTGWRVFVGLAFFSWVFRKWSPVICWELHETSFSPLLFVEAWWMLYVLKSCFRVKGSLQTNKTWWSITWCILVGMVALCDD